MTETKKTKEVLSFRQSLSALYTLTMMQLKEKMDVSFLQSVKKTIFQVVFFILEFVAITAICFLLCYLCKLLSVFSTIGGAIPKEVMGTVVLVMLGLSVIFTTFGLVKSLYLSRDNLVLLTLPATPTIVFLSKLLVYYVYELRKNFMFLIPLFFGYGLVLGYPVPYFAWLFINFLFVAALPIALAALLSMPALFIYQFLKKHTWSQIVATVLGLVSLTVITVLLINSLPEEIDFLKDGNAYKQVIKTLTEGIWTGFAPIAWITSLLIGEPSIDPLTPSRLFTPNTLPLFFGLIFVCAVLIVLCLLFARPLFYSMASKPFEHSKKMRKIKKSAQENNTTPVFLSAIRKEWLMAFRDKSLVSNLIQLGILMPIAIAFLNGLYGAMKKSTSGEQMTVVFNFIITLLFTLSTNINVASVYSRDGSSAYLNKVQPSTYASLLFAKLTVNLLVGFVGIVASTIVYSFYYKVGTVNLPMYAVSAYAIFVAHLFWSGELDLMNPQYGQYATFANQSNNPNENKSSLLCFVLAFLFGLITYLLAMENVNVVWMKIMIGAICLAAFKIFTYFLKIKVYYKEK